MLLKISDIRFDSQYQVRPINQDTVNDYAQAISEGVVLPKPTIFVHDQSYWPGDGRHRILARKQAGHADIEVAVLNGTERDAYLFGITAQDKNGLRLTNEDKRKAVQSILTDDEWSMKYNDHEIAKMCRVSQSFVHNVRASLANSSKPSTISEIVEPCEANEAKAPRQEVPYTTPSGKRSKKKSSAVKHKQRANATTAPYDWKQFDKDFGVVVRHVDKLGKLYNRHNTEDAELLRSDLEAWKGNFKEWEGLLKDERDKACASA